MKTFLKENFKVIICACALLGLVAILIAYSPEAPHNGQTSGDSETLKPGTGVANYTLFDTVSYIYTYAGDKKAAFDENCEEVWSLLAEYHQLFDIYHEYSGVNNLRTLNKNAGGEPIQVSPKLVDFLLYAKELYTLTNGEMNVMMGAVLGLWHDARENGGYIPSDTNLAEASQHVSFDALEIDTENNTVRITDKDARIDVGALGKGYATELAAKHLESKGVKSYVLNIGGNIRIIGTRPDGSGWKTGVKNPKDPNTYSQIITIADTSCVTSGDYERYFTVEGKKYHHIIDKDTLMPADYFSSVTIIANDSGLADCLSTALFCMSYEEGLALVEKIGGVEVLWIYSDGTMKTTQGFDALIVK